jgi:glutathione S-transferase
MSKLTLIIGNKNYSSWSLRPWLAMTQFGIEFEEIRIPLYTPNSSTAIRQYSPAGKVPILIDDPVTIWESLAILEYLAGKFPQQHWWPADPTARAIARSIGAEMHAGFMALRNEMPMNCRVTLPGRGMTPTAQQDIERVKTIWQTCREQFGQNGEWLFGSFTIADAMFAPVVLRFRTYEIALDQVSRAYSHSILSLPAMRSWLQSAVEESESLPQFER